MTTFKHTRKKKRNRIMDLQYFNVHIDDELYPACGCGLRQVVAKVGHKWVRAKEFSYVDNTKNFKRISRKVWDTITADEITEKQLSKMKRIKRRNVKEKNK